MSTDKITTSNPWFWRAVIVMTALFALSAIPEPERVGVTRIIMRPPTWQNLLHVPAYFILAMLWWRTLRTQKWSITAAVTAAVLVSAAYGVLDEVHQYFVPGRFLSVADATLNLVGALLGGAWALIRDRGFVPAVPVDV
jgi:glycopeptide antibiotics resistance protein